MTSMPPSQPPVPSMRPFVAVVPVLSSSRTAPARLAAPLALGPGPPAPAGGASPAAPVGSAGGGSPVDNLSSLSGAPVPAWLSLAGTGAPAPTPRASLADMMRNVANAGMNSVANVNMCLNIVGVTYVSQLCLSKKKEAVSVSILQFGFTATTWKRRKRPSRGEGHGQPSGRHCAGRCAHR
jgi:hypothetical protein